MRRVFLATLFGCSLLAVSACSQSDDSEVIVEAQSSVTKISSRGVDVPVTFVSPARKSSEQIPLVVLAHGHGGSRDEGGGFVQLADRLAELGVASIRMDFPGCGDSSESFVENNLGNMLQDLQAARVFAEQQPGIDATRVGLHGYSMGGRLAALLSKIDSSYNVMSLWAPAVANGAIRENVSLGGEDVYAQMRRTAEETGSVDYTTSYGQDLTLGMQWFVDIEESRPLEALADYRGPLLVLYGDVDEAVPAAISESAIAAATNSSEVVEHRMAGVGHDLGIYTNLEDVAAEVINTTAVFFGDRL